MKIMNNLTFKTEARRLLTKLETRLKRYDKMAAKKDAPGKETALSNLRANYNPQKMQSEYKIGILRASETATQTRRKRPEHKLRKK